TRFSRDWSSDVCSSDLAVLVEDRHAVQRAQNGLFQLLLELPGAGLAGQEEAGLEQPHQLPSNGRMVGQGGGDIGQLETHADLLEIGRASCREREEVSEG